VLFYSSIRYDWAIHCSNGHVLSTLENSIYAINGELSPGEDHKVKALCDPDPYGLVVVDKNYDLVQGQVSYKEAAWRLFWGLATLVFLGEFIRRLVFM
jgi:hypothetical protein